MSTVARIAGRRGPAARPPARRRTGGVAATFVALLALALVSRPGPAVAGDPDLAKYLLKGAKEDVGRRKYDEALVKLRKARTEDPKLLETLYWMGTAHEKKHDMTSALSAYREFLTACAEKHDAGGPSKEETALRPKVQARVDALAAGETELRKLDDAFAERLLAFARARFVRDPNIAAQALEILLGIRPGHEEARKLLARVQGDGTASPGAEGEADGKGPAAGPFQGVTSWKDLIEERFFAKNQGWTYRNGALEVDRHGGQVVTPPSPASPGPEFAYETEFRFLEQYQTPDCALGLAFGCQGGGDMLFALVNAQAVILHQVKRGGRADVAREEVAGLAVGDWHRLGVLVRDARIQVWLDRKKLLDFDAESVDAVRGEVGVFQQDCKVEIRSLRLGKLP